MNYKIGTSGYSYKDWEGTFYPPDLPSGKKLDFYCQHFDVVEINSTYYNIPNPAVFYHLQRKTPDHFEFIVKTHRETTHVRTENTRAMEELHQAVKPLVESGKFRGFLAQFPYSFKNTQTNREYLVRTRELSADFPLFVEFRNWTWNRPELFPFLKLNGIGYVNVDEPAVRGLLPPQEMVTTESAYLRFHGRNQTNWWKGDNTTRYDYLYNEKELQEWVRRLAKIIKRSFRAYIFFNNHPRGQAVKNANMLKSIMQRQQNLFSG